MDYSVEWASEKDWKPAMKLVWRVFLNNQGKETSQKGLQQFMGFLSSEKLHRMFDDGKYPMLVAKQYNAKPWPIYELLGVCTLRDDNLLSLLFVDDEIQSNGIGSALLNELCAYLRKKGEDSLWVNAAPGAVDFYLKHGFERLEKDRLGDIDVVNMVKHL